MTPSPEESTLREQILDIIYDQFNFPNSVVNKSSRSARKFDHEKQADKLLKLIQERERLARIDELKNLLAVALDPDNIIPNWVAKITLEKRLKVLKDEQAVKVKVVKT